MKFTKWQACGNDFVFVNGMDIGWESVVQAADFLCDRHFGIGGDGIIFVLPSEKADFRMRIFNSDGSEAEMCGNGIRCFAKWVYEMGLTEKKRFSVETGAGILYPELLENGLVCVDMGIPHLLSEDIPVIGFGKGPVVSEPMGDVYPGEMTCVSMGNPHCIIFTNDADSISLTEVGPKIENADIFPKKTNVEFATVKGSSIRMHVWERGAGVTLACGTGACATVVAAIRNGLVEKEADVILDGGTLHVSWAGGKTDHVFMTGPAKKVFEGSIEGYEHA